MQNSNVRLGILGGMGPLASATFQLKLLEQFQSLTSCKLDTEFPDIVHISRGFAGLTPEGVLSPNLTIPSLQAAINTLAHAKCTHICIPCNSVHPLFSELDWKGMSVIDMVFATAEHARAICSQTRQELIVLASDSTVKDGSYERALYPLIPTELSAPLQVRVSRLIEAVMSEGVTTHLKDELISILGAAQLHDAVFVLGCTELSLLFDDTNPFFVVDSLQSLINHTADVLIHTIYQHENY